MSITQPKKLKKGNCCVDITAELVERIACHQLCRLLCWVQYPGWLLNYFYSPSLWATQTKRHSYIWNPNVFQGRQEWIGFYRSTRVWPNTRRIDCWIYPQHLIQEMDTLLQGRWISNSSRHPRNRVRTSSCFGSAREKSHRCPNLTALWFAMEKRWQRRK